MYSRKKILLGWATALLLGAGSAMAGTVYSGVDSWNTRGDGSSFTDFAGQPIPAGFFCRSSKAFTGRIVWRGAPIATDDPRITVDTLVQRLDDVTFNAQGRGVTRIQVKALSLESVAPIQTECGAYDVRVNLAGRQPLTRMQIFLDGSEGGRYLAPLALNTKLTFTPADRKAGRTLELFRAVRLGADPRAQWAFDHEKAASTTRPLRVDTDGDGFPETELPRSSNFAAGRSASPADKVYYCSMGQVCHDGSGHVHCVDADCGYCGPMESLVCW